MFKKYLFILIPIVAYIGNLAIHGHALTRNITVITDEGVYLYAAKLIGNGFLPYKDFFLAHPPFLVIVSSLFLSITQYNIHLFHFFYSAWFFLILFPLYFISLKITKNHVSAFLALLLFSTYADLVKWDAHQFALRPASLPFFAFAIFFLIVTYKPKIAGLLLAFFGMCTIPNFFLSIAFLVLYFFQQYLVEKGSVVAFIKKYKSWLLFYVIPIVGYYVIVFLLPSAYNNIISFQIHREPLSFAERIVLTRTHMEHNLPIYAFGFLGSIFLTRKCWVIGVFNIVGMLLIMFGGSSLYEHYFSLMVVGLAITASFVLAFLFRYIHYLSILLVLAFVYHYSFIPLKQELFLTNNQELWQTVQILERTQEPLFAIEPMYALYAHKNLTFHYYVADMRAFGTFHRVIDTTHNFTILQSSNTVLVGPYDNPIISDKAKTYLNATYLPIYNDGMHKIFTKK